LHGTVASNIEVQTDMGAVCGLKVVSFPGENNKMFFPVRLVEVQEDTLCPLRLHHTQGVDVLTPSRNEGEGAYG